MASGNETTTNFKVDISELKKGIQEANRQIKLANAEFKAAASGMDDWQKSTDGVQKKIDQLKSVLNSQKTILDSYKKQLALISAEYGENSKEADEMRIKIANQQAVINNTERSIRNYTEQLSDLERAQQEAAQKAQEQANAYNTLKQKIIEQKSELESLKSQYANVVLEQGANSDAAKNLAQQIENLSKDLQDNENRLQEASGAADSFDRSMGNAESTSETLTEKVKRQQSELNDLKQRYIDVAAEQGESSTEAQNLAQQIENLSGDLQQNQQRLQEASDAADEFDQSLEDVDEETDNTTNGGLAAFGVALGNLVSNLIQAAIDKMRDLVTETIEVGKAFDSSMSQVGAVSGATGDELEALRNKAKEMGSTTKFTASEAADAFNYMAMAGWKTEDMINGVDGVLNLAAASGADLATTSDIVTDALTAMGYAAGDAGRLADVMAAASSNANTNVEMMGETFKYAAPLVGAMGYNMEDTAVAIGLMANAGIKASSAGTSLRSILSRLASPPKAAATAMDKLNISLKKTNEDGSTSMKSLDEVMRDLREAFADLGETEQAAAAKAIAGGEAFTGLLAIVNAAPEDFEKLTEAVAHSGGTMDFTKEKLTGMAKDMQHSFDQLGGDAEAFQKEMQEYLYFEYDLSDSAAQEVIARFMQSMDEGVTSADDLADAFAGVGGVAEDMAGKMLDNLGGDMTLLSSQLEGVQIALYEKFEPALRKGVEALSKLLDVVQFVIDHSAEFTAALGGMAAAVAAYLAYTTALKIMTEGWQALTIVTKAQAAAQAALNFVMSLNPIGLVIAAIAGLVTAFIVLWNKSEKFRNFWLGLWETIKDAASAAWEWIKETFSKLGEFFSGIWNGIKEKASELWTSVTEFFVNAGEKIKEAWTAVKDFFSGIWEGIKEIFSTVAQWIYDNVFTPIMKFFQPVIDFFTAAFEIIFQLAEGCWNLIKAVWSVVAEWFNVHIIQPLTKFFTAYWNGLKAAASAAWDAIKTVWAVVSGWFNTNIIQPVAKFFSKMWDGIKTAASTAWDGIKAVWNVVSGWFDKTIIQPVAKFFTGMWDGLKKDASDAWDGIKSVFGHVSDWFKDVFSKAWQKVKDVFSTGGKVFDGIKDGIVSAFKTVVNAIIRGINKVIAVPFNAINGILDKIQSVSIAGIQPFEGLVSRLPVPEIPQLAQGGVLKRGQVGLLEGNGAEAVVPLENNKKWIAATAAELKRALISEGILGARSEVITNNYNFTQNNTSPKALSRLDIYRQSKNLLSLKGAT